MQATQLNNCTEERERGRGGVRGTLSAYATRLIRGANTTVCSRIVLPKYHARYVQSGVAEFCHLSRCASTTKWRYPNCHGEVSDSGQSAYYLYSVLELSISFQNVKPEITPGGILMTWQTQQQSSGSWFTKQTGNLQ